LNQKNELQNRRFRLDNDFVSAPQMTLALYDLRLLTYILSHLKTTDMELPSVTIRVKEFKDWVGTGKKKTTFSYLDNAIDRLMKRDMVSIKQKDGSVLKVHYVDSVLQNEESGEFTIRLDTRAKGYLLQLASNYTTYSLNMIPKFTRPYAARIYFLMKLAYGKYSKANPQCVRVVYSIQEIKELFNLDGNNTYKSFGKVREKVLSEGNIKEVNEISDIKVAMNPIKKGRTVVSIEFEVSKNHSNIRDIQQEPLTPEPLLIEAKKATERLKKAISNADEKMLVEFLEYIKKSGKKPQIIKTLLSGKTADDFTIDDMISNKMFAGFVELMSQEQQTLL